MRSFDGIVSHYRGGIAAVTASLDGVLSDDGLAARAARRKNLAVAGVPDALAGRLADLGPLAAAPDIVLVADRTGKPVGEVAATYFAAGSFFQLDGIASAAAAIAVTDYFDRLALDRARDLIGDAERRLTAGMVQMGSAGVRAVEEWVAKTDWAEFLPERADIRSNTSICFKVTDPWLTAKDEEAQRNVIKAVEKLLDKEGVANEIANHRDAPPSFRLWGGATVEAADMKAVMDWIGWAYESVKSQEQAKAA